MSQQMGPTGVAPYVPFAFSSSEQRELADFYEQFQDVIPQDNCAKLELELGAACSIYLGLNDLAATSGVTAVRHNLKKASAAGLQFLDALAALDGNSLRLLGLGPEFPMYRIRNQVLDVVDELRTAQRNTASITSRGRRPKFEDGYFDLLVRWALQKNCVNPPTTNKSGAFSTLLRLLDEIVRARAPNARKRASRSALVTRRLSADGDLHTRVERALRGTVDPGDGGTLELIPRSFP